MGYCFNYICYNDDVLGYPVLDVQMTYTEIFVVFIMLILIGVCVGMVIFLIPLIFSHRKDKK